MEQNTNRDKLDDIDVKEIFDILSKEKYKLFFITILFTLLAIVFSLFIPNQYVSYSVMAPSSTLNSSNKISSQYSGVATLAGISLPSSGSDRVQEAIEVMKSLDFFEEFLVKYDLEIPIIAANGWSSKTNELKLDKKIYDINKKKWVSDIKFSINGKPSIQYAHNIFLDNLSIDVDRKTEFVTVSYQHFSPNMAKDIVDLILLEINSIIKEDDVKHAQLSIKFLKEELMNTQIEGIKESLNRLVQSNYETIVLANSSPEYLFKTLSPPYAPEIKSGPQRLYIVLISAFFSFFFSSIYFLARFYSRGTKF